jgi:hypothetical protein
MKSPPFAREAGFFMGCTALDGNRKSIDVLFSVFFRASMNASQYL